MDLPVNRCEACRADAPTLSPAEIKSYLPCLPDWELIEEDGINKLRRQIKTGNYATTMELVNALADAAEEEGHHPLLLVDYGKVTIWWWSHKIKGLHMNDFVMASRTDRIWQQQNH